MSRSGRVLTKHFEIEARQHDLLGLDLGEGPKRRALIIGAAALTIWAGGCLLLFGLPNKYSFSLYTLPPVILTVFGARPSARMGRRMALTDWALAIRYAVLGHRPIVRMGTRQAGRSEYLPLRQRWHIVTGIGARIVPAAARPPWVSPDEDVQQERRPVGPVIVLDQQSRVIGSNTLLQQLTGRSSRRRTRPPQ